MGESSSDERKSRYAGGPHGLGTQYFIYFTINLLFLFVPNLYYLSVSIYEILILNSLLILGDPDDYSLRKIEKNVVITKMVREKAKYEKCAEENKGT